MDLGIEVILELFSKQGLQDVFQFITSSPVEMSPNSSRIYSLQNEYIKTIDSVIEFLQGKQPTLARQICSGNFLPEASRFQFPFSIQLIGNVSSIWTKRRFILILLSAKSVLAPLNFS